MDLSAIKPVTVKVEIRHPATHLPTGLVIEVASMETDAVKKVKRKHMDNALRNRNRKPTAAQIEEHSLESLTAAVIGWEWNGDAAWGGKKPDFTPANVSAVLATDWIRSQVVEVLDDETAFFTS